MDRLVLVAQISFHVRDWSVIEIRLFDYNDLSKIIRDSVRDGLIGAQ